MFKVCLFLEPISDSIARQDKSEHSKFMFILWVTTSRYF